MKSRINWQQLRTLSRKRAALTGESNNRACERVSEQFEEGMTYEAIDADLDEVLEEIKRMK